MKKLLVAGLLVLCVSQAHAYSFKNTGNFWCYGNFTALLSPQWSVVAMPGMNYQISQYNDGVAVNAGNVFVEFFVGPVYTMKLSDNMKLKVPLWYYYLGLPTYATSSHSIDVMPTLEYKINDKFTFGLRVILHNTLYSTAEYYTPDERFGYSLLVKGMPSVTYALSDKINLYASDEVFVGIIQNKNAPYKARDDGFCPMGFRKNRIYIGATYTIDPAMSVSPQYVFETNYDPDKTLISVQHYILVTFNYILKLYK